MNYTPLRTPIASHRASIHTTITNDQSEITPLRRRPTSNASSTPQSSVGLPYRNDEEERSIRRNRSQLHRTITMLETPQKELTLQEARKLFETCVKMNLENKINAKNVWNLNIIDSTVKLLESKEFNRNTLQAASTSLDVSSKVYGIRVDSIHAAGMKLASDMARTGERKNAEALSDENNEGATEQAPKKKRTKRLLGTQKNTIVKDVNTLIAPISKLESTFFQTATSAENSNTDNFFSSRLPLSHCGSKLMILDSATYLNTNKNEDATISTETNISVPMEQSKIIMDEICTDFFSFEVDMWDPENDEFIESSFRQQPADELVLDDLGLPVAELDGSTHDIFDAPDPMEDIEEEEEFAQRQINSAPIVAEIQNVSNLQNMYDFSFLNNQLFSSANSLVSQIWAGPSHWKLKHIQPAKMRFSGSSIEQSAQKAKKKKIKEAPKMIDFDMKVEVDYTKKCVIRKKVPYNPNDDHTSKFTLAERFMPNDKMFLKPSLMRMHTQQKPAVVQAADADESIDEVINEVEVAPYDYENPCDSQYCPQNADDDEDAHNNYTGDNLIDLPNIVPKTTIVYSTQAKNMNMKKLKAGIWKILIKDTTNTEFQEELYKEKIEDSTFSHLYKSLPSILPKKMNEQLSCSLAFVGLLHIANQCSLKLTSSGADLRDFSIVQDG